MWGRFCGGFRGFNRYGMMDGYGFNGWESIGMMVLQLAVIIGVIYLIVRLIRPKSNDEDHALALLKDKFARGEISKEEFTEKKEVLKE